MARTPRGARRDLRTPSAHSCGMVAHSRVAVREVRARTPRACGPNLSSLGARDPRAHARDTRRDPARISWKTARRCAHARLSHRASRRAGVCRPSSTPRRARAPNLSPAWLGARPPRGAHPADRGAHLHVRRCVVRHDRGRRAVYLVSGDKQSPWRQPSNGACAGTHRTTHAGQPMLLQQPLGAKRRARAPLLAARILARYGRCLGF